MGGNKPPKGMRLSRLDGSGDQFLNFGWFFCLVWLLTLPRISCKEFYETNLNARGYRVVAFVLRRSAA
jgi:hypothetical protein